MTKQWNVDVAHSAVQFSVRHMVISKVRGAFTRFVLSYAHIFAPTRGVHVAGVRFVVAIAAQLAANSALLAAFTQAGVAVWPAQVSTTVLLTVVNYLVYRWWVFR